MISNSWKLLRRISCFVRTAVNCFIVACILQNGNGCYVNTHTHTYTHTHTHTHTYTDEFFYCRIFFFSLAR